MLHCIFERRSWTALALIAVLGCGGKSAVTERENEGGADPGGSSGAGGSFSSSGGSPSRAGQGGQGGAGMPGASGDAGSAQAGRGGTTADELCSLPAPSLRPCDGVLFYFHDPVMDECVPVPPWDCPDSSENTFASLAACLSICPSARPAPSACDAPSDCIVVQPGCCGGCEPVEREQLVTIHHERRDTVSDDCEAACGPCNDVTELERTWQYFVPGCAEGLCQILDLRESPATECDADDDCTLRDGSSCCEGCDGTGLVALSSEDPISATCGEDFACDTCVPPASEDYEPACNDDGRCVVRPNLSNSDGRLIAGDPQTCPPRSNASSSACDVPPAADCIYAGGEFGSSVLGGAVTCFCDDDSVSTKQWVCLATDAEGNSECPRNFPPPGPCARGLECDYGVGVTVANCYCSREESAEGSFDCAL